MDAINLASPDLYINRELSLLEFNRRVLAQAMDDDVPLLERLKFLCIAGSNLDEFFEIRVAGLKQQQEFGSTQRGPDNLSPAEQLQRIGSEAHDLVAEQYRVLNDVLLPLLATQGIRFLRRDEWNKRQVAWLARYFHRELEPVLSPVGLDPAHPFPRVLNKSLNFIVTLDGTDDFGRSSGRAIVQAPRSLPRVVRLADSVAQSPYEFVFLSSIIHTHVADLFPGMNVTGCYQFRVTRNSDLFVDEEEIDDLKHALEGELSSRRFGDEVRLEVADHCPRALETFLRQHFELADQDIYRCNGPVNLTRLMTVPDQVDRPDLKYPGFTPSLPVRIQRSTNMFDVIRRGDLLLHHPFQSFAPVVDFIRQSGADPHVLAIRQTLYRTGADSAIVKALMQAARNGKEVTVVVELRARFDEAENISLSTGLEEAGAHVVYGVVGRKTHAKMSLVVRREGRSLRRYVHMGTGNYHARTARLYTDYGLFTCDAELTEDVHKVFQQLTAFGNTGRLSKILQSPFTLHSEMLRMIAREAELARAGRPARIMAKMNSLIEQQVIQALYAASQAGVSIDLIVRGVCALRPGVPGVSDNIRVRSVIGRFLEHTRVFCFGNDGDRRVYLSSADWMGRNFFARVETCFPIDDKALADRVVRESLELYLQDNTQAWSLQSDGRYQLVLNEGGQRCMAQERLLTDLADRE